ncbi:MAG TPA: sigma-70 family RNA polymerase sigma factor [Rhizobiaceae bacterium]|mgnify:CR=1 FL=1|nr:sigma-70 family RNA polymerase sigma factor [Rhizobiaceae bacterium]
MSTPEEIARLLSRVALRDRAAFDVLYGHVSAKLFGVCLRLLRDRQESEDALQEVFVKVWHKADRYAASGASPMPWLIAIARNHAIDRLRARRPAGSEIGEAEWVVDDAPTPESSAVQRSERRRIDDCLDRLQDERAAAVRGAYLDGDSYEILAERFAVPLNTMRTWLRRSLIKLRECLEE